MMSDDEGPLIFDEFMREEKDRPSRVLVVDDEASLREFLTIMLKREGCVVTTAASGDEAIAVLNSGERFALIITDLSMPGTADGIDVLRKAKEVDSKSEVLVVTAYATPETAVSALKSGAYDYLIKPFKLDQVRATVRRALEKYDLLTENAALKEELVRREIAPDIIAQSEPMEKVLQMVQRVARTQTTILVHGESGTGKELVARAIHQNSPVSDGPFIPVNCGAIPENLIEAELFGYKKGAFTGAVSDHVGLIESASGGTVFLDEIGELPLTAQVRLLRVLQEKKVKPVGDTHEKPVDVRIVAATNRNLLDEVREGRFREDLYYRLNVIPIGLPPLRERGADVKLLINHFIEAYARKFESPITGIEPEALRALVRYDYPGNVRELQNIIERAITLELGDTITSNSLPPHVLGRAPAAPSSPHGEAALPDEGIDLEKHIEGIERKFLLDALERSGGNKTEAAKLLGISFRSFRYRLSKQGLE